MGKRENPIKSAISWIVSSSLWDIIKFGASVVSAYSSKNIPEVSMLTKMVSPWVLYPAIGLMVYGAFQIVTDLLNMIFVDKMLLINRQRSKGVELRSASNKIKNKKDSDEWVEDFDRWDKETEIIIRRFDPAFGEYFKYINSYELIKPNKKGFDELQTLKINALIEKLARLQKYYKDGKNQ